MKRRRPRTKKCKGCGDPIMVAPRGRVPTYCGQTCKQQAYERRRRRGPMLALVEDIATAKIQQIIRDEVRNCLVQAGLIDAVGAVPRASKAQKPKLSLITNDRPIATNDAEQHVDPTKQN
jgi:hypothetical protein